MSPYVLVFAASVLLSVLTSIIWFKKRNLIESAILGVVWFFCSHVFACFGLFLIDGYSLFRAICLTCLLDAAVLGTVVGVRRPKPFSIKGLFRCRFSLKPMIIPLLICLLALPFSLVKNEFFGMGQDQGVYQTQALLFLYGDDDRQKNFDEYASLISEEERAFFRQSLKDKLGGYDIAPEDYPETVYDRNVSEVSGIIHGIPTHAAILAMWGEVFGIAHMADVETIFYLCLIFLVWCTCYHLRLRPVSCTIASLCTAFAPIVIWVSKASLTEMFLSLLPALFLYILTDDKNSRTKWISIIPVAVFGCFHVSFYTMVPLFLMVYGGLYFFTRERQYAVLLPVTVLGYLASYFGMRHIQPFYTMNNYKPLFGRFVNVHNLTLVVTLVNIAALAAVLLFVFFVSRTNKHFYAMQNWNERAAQSRVFPMLLRLLLVLPVVFILIRTLLCCGTWEDASRTTLLGFIGNAGLIIVPFALCIAVIRPKFCIEQNARLVVFLTFFYCILAYSAFLRFEIQYYYYYARYLAPFIAVAAVFAAMMLDSLKKRWLLPAAAAGMCFVLPFDVYLLSHRDDTRMEWTVLEDTADAVREADCILIDRDYLQLFWLPLTAMTDADVLPAEGIISDEVLAELSTRYGSIACITNNPLPEEDTELRYRNLVHSSEDDLNHTAGFLPFSLKFLQTEETIYVYHYDKYSLAYRASECYAAYSGFSVLETDFCWSIQEQCSISCHPMPDEYQLRITLGSGIPDAAAPDGTMEVTVFLGDTELGEISIPTGVPDYSACLAVPEHAITDGNNLLRFESTLWEAAQVNPDDPRILGFPLKSVVFEPVE